MVGGGSLLHYTMHYGIFFHLAGEHDTYVHMASAKGTECAVDSDKIQEDNASFTDHESKNTSPNTDSTPTGENAYTQIH